MGCIDLRGIDIEVGKSFFLKCLDDCVHKTVWGCPSNGGWVTHDSAICKTAHMLNITLRTPFAVVMSEGQEGYDSCSLNGITSYSYGKWHASYRIQATVGKSFQFKAYYLQVLFFYYETIYYGKLWNYLHSY